MDTVLSIIDENKEKISDGDYLKLCNAMKQIYDYKELTTIYQVIYRDNTGDEVIEITGNSNKRGILFSPYL